MSLTSSDIIKLINAMEKIFLTKVDFDEFKQDLSRALSHTESRLMDHIDSFVKSKKDADEELPLIKQQLSDHSDRIETLEKTHPQGQHLPA